MDCRPVVNVIAEPTIQKSESYNPEHQANKNFDNFL